MDNMCLAIGLASCESEKEIIDLLQKYSLWDNTGCWRAFGDNDNNWSTIGNQQSDADAALVEKIVNSIDALLMKECMIRGIEPTSDAAPKSIADALDTFFGITGGKIQNLTESERTNLAQNDIILAATGNKGGDPNITIVDRGEGQSPRRMPDTILSINKSNKLKVPFVQGKFNMGGTGVLCFCGEHNFQLIICRRCPEIPANGDASHNLWGVTVVRRERPTGQNGLRSSKFTYLTDKSGNILSFEANEGVKIIPSSKGENEVMEFGMFCKMFEYKMPSRLRTNINMNLYTRLSMLLPNLAYPAYLDECREGFRGHTFHRTLSGLNVRLSDQLAKGESSNIETCVSVSFSIEGQKVDAAVYVFKKKSKDKNGKEIEVDLSQYRGKEGVLLTQNGQTHGSYDRKFYSRNAVGLSYLAESLLTIVDCTGIDEATREELFMNSRDRTRASIFATKLETFLEEYLKENDVLKQIQQRRREEAISDKLDDEKPLEDVLSSVFKSSTVLSRLFILGKKLQNPTNLGPAAEAEDFEGKYNPTYFTIVGKKDGGKDPLCTKDAQENRKFRIRFRTDAVNDFFSREKYPGTYLLMRDDGQCEDYIIHLHNGIATLNVELPADAKVGDSYQYSFVVTDTNIDRSFENEFAVRVIAQQESKGGNGGKRTPPDGDKSGGNSLAPNGISLPNVVEIGKEQWAEHNFTKESALNVMKVDDIYDFYVNMDNIHLQTEIKPVAKNEGKMRLLKARYKYSMVLVGLGVLGYYDSHKEDEEQKSMDSPEEMIQRISEMVSPVLLPMIDVMGDDMSDIINY